jgi:hypothetical protein
MKHYALLLTLLLIAGPQGLFSQEIRMKITDP